MDIVVGGIVIMIATVLICGVLAGQDIDDAEDYDEL